MVPEHALRQKTEKKLKVSWRKRILTRRRKRKDNSKHEWEDANPMVRNSSLNDHMGAREEFVDDEGIEVDFYDCVFNQVGRGERPRVEAKG